MPTSWFEPIPVICKQLEKYQPKRVLDIGTGWGKYGFLAREYGHAKVVDGVEGEPRYVSKIQKAIYDHFYVFDIRDNLDKLSTDYDLVLFIDTIEHMKKDDGHRVLQYFKDCTIIVSTPDMDFGQVLPEWPLEEHMCRWYPEDFRDYHHDRLIDPSGQALIVVINP